ncbi:hypothetical protein [Sphingomonas sp. 3-13AW]|uniref:hypothetical protein n=1 Tax=Sphingomonas sp. 3-13AW TaxID=3050450 RepID=UPI003BB6D5C3
MNDKIIPRRHNTYRLRAGVVAGVDQGKGPLLQAGIGSATMERISMVWDTGDAGEIVRRFPAEVRTGDRLYSLYVETGVSVHPERPVFLFNAGNGHQHREVNAPAVRSPGQLAADRLPVLLAAVVAGAFSSIYGGYDGEMYQRLTVGLQAALAVLVLAWVLLLFVDVRENRRRAERLEDETSAAKESAQLMNSDISERLGSYGAQDAQPGGTET